MASCIAIISDENRLLYLRTADECPDALFYHFKVHAALDVIEDKLARRAVYSSSSQEQTEQYFGLLYPMDDHRLYGYVTNTQVKFILVQESSLVSPDSAAGSPSNTTASPLASQQQQQNRDQELRALFQRLHTAYTDLVSSPFYKRGSPIQPDNLPAAARFHRVVGSLLAPSASAGVCPILSLGNLWSPLETDQTPLSTPGV